MRTFVAVDLGPVIRAGLRDLELPLRALARTSRWVAVEDLHLTLVFLGDVAEGASARVFEAVDRAAARHRAFALQVEGGGAFGRPARPRVLWAGVTGDLPELAAVQKDLEAELAESVGHAPEDRSYSPHVTLARAGSRSGDPSLAACAAALATGVAGAVRVEAITVYESRAGEAGSRYVAVHRAMLGGG